MRPVFRRRRRRARRPTLLVQPTTFGSFATIAGDLLLMAHHLVEGDALDRLGADVEAALILARQEALRDEHEQIARCRPAARATRPSSSARKRSAAPQRASRRAAASASNTDSIAL